MSLFLPIFAQSFWNTYLILFSPIFIITIYLPNVNQTSCQVTLVSQLLSIVHEIQSSFDYNPPTDVRAIFLYIWKALDEVWHQGLLSKSKLYLVEGDLLEIYFDNRKQRVILDGQCSSWSWKTILSGIPHGLFSGPLLFRIYINDFPNGLNSIYKVFADETSIFSKVFDTDKFQRSFNDHYFKRNGIQSLEIQMQENMDQKNTEYGHLLCSEWFIHNKWTAISMEIAIQSRNQWKS